jgi:hypothetical protein
MHKNAGEFADRPVAGNSGLVQKLATALVEAVKQDFKNSRQAKAAIKKLLAE